jgi:hypothetical protein
MVRFTHHIKNVDCLLDPLKVERSFGAAATVPDYEIFSLLEEDESHQGLQSGVSDKVSEVLGCFCFLS